MTDDSAEGDGMDIESTIPRQGAPSEMKTVRMTVEEVAGQPRDGDGVTLLFYHRNGASTISVGEGASVEIGRERPCDVVIPDDSLSRRHARFRVIGGTLFVEDLGSTNGVRIDERPLTPELGEQPVGPSAVVLLGTVAVRQASLRGARQAIGQLESFDELRRHLEDELVRARCFSRSCATLALRGRTPGHAAQASLLLLPSLRAVDRMALYSRNTLVVLLPEIDAAAAAALAREHRDEFFAGIAAFPPSGTTADELLEGARAALARTSADEPIAIAESGARALPRAPVVPTLSAAMKQLYDTVARLHRSAIPVLVFGETGAGKEVLARAIHDKSARSEQRIISVNCGALPSQLMESQLFGHEKGAFTGADKQHIGVFETAHNGTVFLDEVAELPLEAQAKLLRVLADKKITRLGSTKDIPVDVRIVAATHRDLEDMVKKGQFREDLFYRLEGMVLRVPPLRERREEIVPLAQRFLAEAAAEQQRKLSLSAAALDVLTAYPWPGNVRELKNAMERAAAIALHDTIGSEDLPERVRRYAPPQPTQPPLAAPTVAASTSTGAPVFAIDLSQDLKTLVRNFEGSVIKEALRRTGGNQTDAARLLRTPLRTFVHKMRALGVSRKRDEQ